MTTNFFSLLSSVAIFGSGTRDPGSGMGKNQDPGSATLVKSGSEKNHSGSTTLSPTQTKVKKK
jgi:hypothetical protein